MFVESKAPWFEIADDLPKFEGKVPFEQRVELWRDAGRRRGSRADPK